MRIESISGAGLTSPQFAHLDCLVRVLYTFDVVKALLTSLFIFS